MKIEWLIGRRGPRIAHEYVDAWEWSVCGRARRTDRHTPKTDADRKCVHCVRRAAAGLDELLAEEPRR